MYVYMCVPGCNILFFHSSSNLECACVFVCVCVCKFPWMAGEGVRAPQTEVTGGCEPPSLGAGR